jgi:flagellar motor switch protein FliG
MITTIKDGHNKQLRLFREVEGVEKALIQNIVKAIEPSYLTSLLDRNSNSLRGTVNDILAHLQTTYSRTSPQMMDNRDQALQTMVYNSIFHAVEDFSNYADLAQQPNHRQSIPPVEQNLPLQAIHH